MSTALFKRSVRFTLVLVLFLSSLIAHPRAGSSPRLESCKLPGAPEPWRDANQTPQCRTLELIHAMTLDEKISQLGPTFGKPVQSRLGIPSLHANDGPNGWAKGPFPGSPAIGTRRNRLSQ